MSGDALNPRVLEPILRAAKAVGISHVKITGGEPLLRSDIGEVVKLVKSQGMECSLVTNGFYLPSRMGELVESALDRLNVSLPSLNPSVYRFVTGSEGLERVVEGLRLCREYSMPAKINMVLLKGLNSDDVVSMIEYASKNGFDMNIIELVPVGLGARDYAKYHMDVRAVEPILMRLGGRPSRREFQNRPMYELPTGIRVELINGYGNPLLCRGCTRVRLTHDGFLKPCLYREDRVLNLVEAISRQGGEAAVKTAERYFRLVNDAREPFFK